MNRNTNYKKTTLGKTTLKYLRYVCDVIDSHNLTGPMTSVNLKDNTILSNYFSGNYATVESAYRYMIKKLLSLGIISVPDKNNYFIRSVRTYRYNIEKSKVMDLLDYYDLDYPNGFNYQKVSINNNVQRIYIPKQNEVLKSKELQTKPNEFYTAIYNIVLEYISNNKHIDIDILIDRLHSDCYYPLNNIKILKHIYKLVRIGSVRINIEKYQPTEDLMNALLYLKYPLLYCYQKKNNEMNAEFHSDDKYKEDVFRVSISCTAKNITKLGIRQTNAFAQLHSCEKTVKKTCWKKIDGRNIKVTEDTGVHHDYKGSREEFLFVRDHDYYYDVKGSISTIARAKYKGIVKDLSTDTYKEMYRDMFDEWNQDIRSLVKSYNMRMLFGGTAKNIFYKLRRVGDYLTMEFIDKMKEKEEEYCGNPNNDTSVFMDESCIYMDVKEEIESRGISVYQCYDGFYFDKPIDDIEDIIKNCIIRYINRWYK